MSDIILALKPKWAHLILEKKKKTEVRRILPKNLSPQDKCYLYCHGSILGYAVVSDVYVLDDSTDDYELAPMAEFFCDEAILGEQEMIEYMRGGKRAGIIRFSKVHKYAKPKPHEGAYPQNFVYVDKQSQSSKPKQTELNL